MTKKAAENVPLAGYNFYSQSEATPIDWCCLRLRMKIIFPRTFDGTFESSACGNQGSRNCHLGSGLSAARIISGSTED
jgi:hypothetical protein